MPYKNIVFVKLEKRLLNDHRWFGMSDKAQLLYIKLMLGCAETYNKLPTKGTLLRQQLHISWKQNVFDSALNEILNNFPKFKKVDNFYYFEDFESKTNYVKEIQRKSQVIPKEAVYIDIDKDIDIEKEETITQSSNEPTFEEVKHHFESLGHTTKDAENFYSYYKAQEWRTTSGISIKKNWQHKVIGWMNNQKQFGDKNGSRTNQQRRKDYVTKDEYKSELESLYKGGN